MKRREWPNCCPLRRVQESKSPGVQEFEDWWLEELEELEEFVELGGFEESEDWRIGALVD